MRGIIRLCGGDRLPSRGIRSRVRRFLCSRQREPPSSESQEKRYVHIPTHAASDFLMNATPRHMKKANEIL